MAQKHQINPRYVGEQVGPNEHRLKDELAEAFHGGGAVSKAYLAHADLGDGSHNVVLGVVAPDRNHETVVAQVQKIFGSIFDSSQHLDILFLDPDGEADLLRVCRPFFERRAT